MDIRKFFSPPSSKKSSDSNKSVVVKQTKRKSSRKKGVLFDSDSSDESPIPKNVRKQLDSSEIIAVYDSEDEYKKENPKQKSKHIKKKAVKKIDNEALHTTTPNEFFGNFKQSVKKNQTEKRKSSDEVSKPRKKIMKMENEDLDLFDELEKMKAKSKSKTTDGTENKETIANKLTKRSSKTSRSKNNVKDSDINQKANTTPLKDKSFSKNSSSLQECEEIASNTPVKIKSKSTVTRNSPMKSKLQGDMESSSLPLAKVKTHKKGTPKKREVSQKILPAKKNQTPKKVETPPKKPSSAEIPVQTDESSAKKERFLKFKQWQNRTGPAAPGSKEVPKGADFCFEGNVFVITGSQESLSREEIRSLVERYGGKVTTSVSSRTSYLIAGEDAGESKLQKAAQHKTKVISEDEFLDLLRTLPGKKSKYDVDNLPVKQLHKTPSMKQEKKYKDISSDTSKSMQSQLSSSQSSTISQNSTGLIVSSQEATSVNEKVLMWVDKYKPQTIKQIIGQQGANSNMNKLINWLKNWHTNHRTAEGKAKPKPKINQWGGGDPAGASLKAALLSGPPGVGKTTTATLVCQELGLSYIELNASDTRSKRTLKEDVAGCVQTTSISNLFGSSDHAGIRDGSNQVLIMDEVDGMAGNEDRGGMQELIQIIKTTKIPIICMCNDRSAQKMRSLTNYCFDLRFQRPRVEQITGSVMSICYKEGVNVQAPAVQAIIRGCNQDVRQVLHNLNMIKASNTSLSYDDAKSHADHSQKDVNLGIFDVAKKLLSSEFGSTMSINDKSNLFFMDYSMVPKFMQENYLHVTPFAAKGNIIKQLELVSKTADSIALGDHIEATIRHDQAWNMLPTLGLMSTVLPSFFMRGGMRGMINFPSFFGKLSTTGKNHRLLQELKFHCSLPTNGCTEETFNLDLAPYLRWHLTRPLIEQSRTGENEVHRVTTLLDDYDLIKDDFDNIVEIGQYQGKANPMSKVDSKVKAALTRTYNKESHLTPYAVESAAAKKKKKITGIDPDEVDSQQSQEGEASDDDMGVDGMIKTKKKAASSSKSRGKGSKSDAGSNPSKKRKKN